MNEAISKLSQDDALTVLRSEIGYYKPMPDILTFLDDDYFLGGIYYDKVRHKSRVYDYWRWALTQVFPNDVTSNTFISVSGAIGCLRGDTKIRLATGELVKIKDIADSKQFSVPLYSFDIKSKSIRLGTGIDCICSGITDIYRVTFTDDSYVEGTYNHPFLLTDGTYRELTELRVNDLVQGSTIHKVKGVSRIGFDKVYDITVPDYNNFGIEDQNGNLIFTHNTGKSTFTQIIFLYDFLKYSYIANPGSYLELLNLNGIKFVWLNLFKYKAYEQCNPINEIISKAPCFQDLAKEMEETGIGRVSVIPGASTKDIISQDVPVFGLSEINFMGDKATEMINACLSRLESRFQKGIDLLTHFILDSSDVSSTSPTELFIHNSAYSNRVLSFHVPIWKAKPHQYGKMGWFKVYAGDSAISPHILDDREDTSDLDPDRIVTVPGELRPSFESDIQLALQEKVGIGLISGGMLFPDEKIKKNFNIPKSYNDVDVVDFFNGEQILDLPGIREAVDMLPNDRALFIGLDAGLKNDKYGIAVGYADNLVYKTMPDGKQVPDIFIKVPIAFSLSRKKGQETSISKVRDFIMYLASTKIVKKAVLDTYASDALRQELTLNKVDAKFLSVDRTDQPYLLFKRLMYENRINIADNKLLYRELKCLSHSLGKVDHTNSGGEGLRFGDSVGENSKDCADAVCRVVQEIYNMGPEAFYAPKEDVTHQQNYMSDLYRDMLRARQIKREIMRSKLMR